MSNVGCRIYYVINRFAMRTKKISLPSIEKLDSAGIADVSAILEAEAPKFAINCVNWKNQYPYHPITAFSAAHSSRYIYVDFFTRCNYLRAVNYKNNSPVSQDSCVEFFMQLPGSDEYWNFEFNCIGTVNASHRKERNNPHRLTDDEISQIKRYASCGVNPFQELEGLFSWSLTVGIPFSLTGIENPKFPMEISGNFYKCASATSMPHYLSLFPIKTEKPDFHRPEFFGKIILE